MITSSAEQDVDLSFGAEVTRWGMVAGKEDYWKDRGIQLLVLYDCQEESEKDKNPEYLFIQPDGINLNGETLTDISPRKNTENRK